MAWPIPLPAAAVSEIAHTIQLAVAPVFLLAGIGTILNVLAGRLSRVIDRARALEEKYTPAVGPDHDRLIRELRLLDRRMTIVNIAIFLCTASAMTICALVAVLFVSDLAELRYGRVVAVMFILAMALLVLGLFTFLLEVRVALTSNRVRPELLRGAGRGGRAA
jgi:hypothetical protein